MPQQKQKQKKLSLREQNRLKREAQKRQQRIYISSALVVLLLIVGFFAVRGFQAQSQAASATATLIPTPTVTGVVVNQAMPTVDPSIQTVTIAGGLKYQDIVVGTGGEAKTGDKVNVQYTGWLTDGTKFDSSFDHGGKPFSFTLGNGEVIKGWDQGVAGMKVGGKRRLTIPPALGYGSNGAGSTIPPDATLIFDVELVSILSKGS